MTMAGARRAGNERNDRRRRSSGAPLGLTTGAQAGHLYGLRGERLVRLASLHAEPPGAELTRALEALIATVNAADEQGTAIVDPASTVSTAQAATLCERRDARLCSFAEWSRACAGTKGRRFPYGPSAQADRCNTASIAGFPQELAAAGAYADCVTAEGFHDLVGNVGEWAAEGIAVGGDSSTPIAEATCKAKGRPPKGFSGPDLGFRCCMDRGPLGR